MKPRIRVEAQTGISHRWLDLLEENNELIETY